MPQDVAIFRSYCEMRVWGSETAGFLFGCGQAETDGRVSLVDQLTSLRATVFLKYCTIHWFPVTGATWGLIETAGTLSTSNVLLVCSSPKTVVAMIPGLSSPLFRGATSLVAAPP